MTFFYKLIKTDIKTTVPFKKKLPYEEEQPLPVLIDESLLQQPPLDLYQLDSVDVSLPAFTDISIFHAFEKALETYVNLDAATFNAFVNQLPTKKPLQVPDFLNVQFEDLFKIPVRVKSADVAIIKVEIHEGHVESAKQIENEDDFNKSRVIAFSFDNTYLPVQPAPNTDGDFIPVLPTPADDVPYTPTITLDGQNTQNKNRESFIVSQEGSTLTGNLFESGASFGMAGGSLISLSLYQPVRPGSVLITNLPGQYVIVTPEENSLVLYTSTTLEHKFGDFEYNLVAPIFTPPEPFFVQFGSKVFVDKFRYSLTASDFGSSTGLLQVQIVDDVPTATPKANDANETLYFVNGIETATGNLVLDNDGFGPSSFGGDGGFVSKVNGVTTIIADTITASTTYGSIVVYANDHIPFDAGDYIYSLDGSKTSPVNDALLQVNDVITYRLTDNDGNVASSTLTITITLNQPPQATDDDYSVSQGQILIVDDISGVLTNDVVSPGDTKTVLEVNGNAADVGVQVNLPSGALLTMADDGSFDYDPNGLTTGQSDDFAYTLEEAEGLTSIGQVHVDITLPIIFDLTGRGFNFLSLENANTSWLFPDGQNHKVAWCEPELGVLVYDENQNGIVDGRHEFSFSLYDLFAQSDLEGLKYFDSDRNDVFDERDEQFDKFALWLDQNHNGKSDVGELISLKDLGIASIELQSDGQYQVIEDTFLFGIGHFHKEDGSQGNFADAGFRVGQIVSEAQLTTIPHLELH